MCWDSGRHEGVADDRVSCLNLSTCCSCASCKPGAVAEAGQQSSVLRDQRSSYCSPGPWLQSKLTRWGQDLYQDPQAGWESPCLRWWLLGERGIEEVDLWEEQQWDGTLSSVINGSINKAWSRGTLQIYGFLSPPADAIMADRTECLSRGNWAGIMKKGGGKQAEFGVHFYPPVRIGW